MDADAGAEGTWRAEGSNGRATDVVTAVEQSANPGTSQRIWSITGAGAAVAAISPFPSTTVLSGVSDIRLALRAAVTDTCSVNAARSSRI